MQGKSTQDWTDDADFWDEAWGDMQHRLDDKPARKGIALWLPWLVPLVLLLIGIVSVQLLKTDVEQVQPAQPAAQAEITPVIAASVINNTQEENPAIDQASKTVVADATVEDSASGNKDNAFSTPSAPAAAAPTSPTKQANTLVSNNEQVQISNGVQLQALTQLEAGSALSPTLSSTPKLEAEGQPKRPELAPVNPLLATPLTGIPNDLELPETKDIRHNKRHGAFAIEAGLTRSSGTFTPGYLAGLTYAPASKGRLNFALSARYRKDVLSVGTSFSGGGPNTDISTPTSAGGNTNFDQVLSDISQQDLDKLTLTGLELKAGAGYRLTSRLNLGIGIGGSYLLSARGITNLQQEGETYTLFLSSRQSSLDALTNNEFTVLGNQLRSGSISDNTGINRYQLRSYLDLSYRVTSRLDLTANVNLLMTPVYESGLTSVRKSQVGVGVRYRFR
jgi:opacity protein-like surface antigen